MHASKTVFNDLNNCLSKLSQEVPYLIHSWRFAAGASYALQEAIRLGYVEWSADEDDPTAGKKYVSELRSVLSQFYLGSQPEQKWLAGFFFNVAIIRIDASYERTLRTLIPESQRGKYAHIPEIKKNGKEAWVHELARTVDDRFFPDGSFKRRELHSVRYEVNRLKYEVLGRPPGGAVTIDQVVEALRELTVLLNNSKVQEFLKGEYGGAGPTS